MNVKKITIDGNIFTVRQLSEWTGITPSTIRFRLRQGDNFEMEYFRAQKILSKPVETIGQVKPIVFDEKINYAKLLEHPESRLNDLNRAFRKMYVK